MLSFLCFHDLLGLLFELLLLLLLFFEYSLLDISLLLMSFLVALKRLLPLELVLSDLLFVGIDLLELVPKLPDDP